jgi:carbonic anhydrase
MNNNFNSIITSLKDKNNQFQSDYFEVFASYLHGQSPRVAVLSCSDSRVIPELIFNASIGELFVVRVAGNIAIDQTVIASLEYAVNHLGIRYLIILGHTHCGAVKVAETSLDSDSPLVQEIRKSFHLDEQNHVKANLTHQLLMLPQRSVSIEKAVNDGSLDLFGAIYHLEDGHIEFIIK